MGKVVDISSWLALMGQKSHRGVNNPADHKFEWNPVDPETKLSCSRDRSPSQIVICLSGAAARKVAFCIELRSKR